MKAFDLSSLKILIIDDHKFSLSLMREILRTFHCREVHVADDVDAAMKMSDVMTPDIIFCDYEMSPISGLDFTKMVRAGKTAWDFRVPVVMLTSHCEKNRVIAARDVGSTYYLAKPISATSVYRRIHNIIDRPRPFIRCSTYIGPDRRNPRSVADFVKEDRRKQTDGIEENPDVSLSKAERDTLVAA